MDKSNGPLFGLQKALRWMGFVSNISRLLTAAYSFIHATRPVQTTRKSIERLPRGGAVIAVVLVYDLAPQHRLQVQAVLDTDQLGNYGFRDCPRLNSPLAESGPGFLSVRIA